MYKLDVNGGGQECPPHTSLILTPRKAIQRAALSSRPSCGSKSGLRRLYILCLPALGSLDYIELDLLTFLQAPKSTGLDGGEVYEYILSILAADETITLGVVKPLYCSCFHGVALFPFSFRCALMYSLEFCRQVTLGSGSYWKLQKPQSSNAAGLYLSLSGKCYDVFGHGLLSGSNATVSGPEIRESKQISRLRRPASNLK